MIVSVASYLFVYLVGGLTLLPAALLFCWHYYIIQQPTSQTAKEFPSSLSSPNNDTTTTNNRYGSKQGWIKLMTVLERPAGQKSSAFENGWTSVPKKKLTGGRSCFSSALFYGLLRHGTLFCFDNDQQETCLLMLPLRNYTVSLYPKNDKAEAELFGRIMSVCLAPKNTNSTTTTYYYITCQRPIDKEDWYFALKAASYYMLDDNNNNTTTTKRKNVATTAASFDPWAMSALRGLLDGNSAQVDAQCWNAMIGRLFLGVYKTETWRQLWYTKMKSKLEKINSFHQHPLQEMVAEHHHGDTGAGYGKKLGGAGKRTLMRLLPLELQLISMGETIPCLTQAQLVEFSPDGTCMMHAQLDYDGDFLVVLRSGLHTSWRPPSSLLSPFGKKKKTHVGDSDGDGGGDTSTLLPLVLSLKLRHCSGKMVFKIKPPPTCRVWAAFDTMPTMEWQITPVVLDKQIKWSYVIQLVQAKIRELVAESLVMPNMEDFPFYDSGGLGGIFGNHSPGPAATTAASVPTTSTSTATATATVTAKVNNDKDSAIDVDIANEKDHHQKQQQQQQQQQQEQQQPAPMVSTLVQGYMDRIRNSHKYSRTSLSSLDTTTTAMKTTRTL